MSVNEKMTAIADAIRSKTGKTEALGLDAMAEGVGEVYEKGRQDVLKVCYKTSVMGSGTKAFSVELPFEPDVVIVHTKTPYIRSGAGFFETLELDVRSCARYCGTNSRATDANKVSITALTTATNYDCITYEEGLFTFAPTAAVFNGFSWSPDVRYDVLAAKYDLDAKTLVESQVALLPDDKSGTVEYNQDRINTYFTAEEWAALIATKPNWTFSML